MKVEEKGEGRRKGRRRKKEGGRGRRREMIQDEEGMDKKEKGWNRNE